MVLDMSKAFDKVCDQGLVSKLQCNVISENFLKLLENVLGYRKHSVVLIGHCSNWADVNSAIPQGFSRRDKSINNQITVKNYGTFFE